ncbi:MAG: YigZ family protein, partial [Clostridia bacterium]|nr:YigZ family protein [Clostridia bacterium]
KPVTTEQEALDYLQEMRSAYSDANHNVYAYVIDENNISRYSDDGEPSGTAGLPVLDVMKKEGIVDAVAVVTRYFGGPLLGTGGLVHAYSYVSAEAIKNAVKITKELCDSYKIGVEYTLSGKVQYLISSKGYFQESAEYGERVVFTVLVKKSESKNFERDILETCAGRAEMQKNGEKYIVIKT